MRLGFRIRPPNWDPEWPKQKFRKKDQGTIPVLQMRFGEIRADILDIEPY